MRLLPITNGNPRLMLHSRKSFEETTTRQKLKLTKQKAEINFCFLLSQFLLCLWKLLLFTGTEGASVAAACESLSFGTMRRPVHERVWIRRHVSGILRVANGKDSGNGAWSRREQAAPNTFGAAGAARARDSQSAQFAGHSRAIAGGRPAASALSSEGKGRGPV